jgi:hypothetical protein
MTKLSKARPIAGVLLLGVAVFLWVRGLNRTPASEKAFFYDLSANRIFVGSRSDLPPIRGVDGPEEDAFRAVVISMSGKPKDRDSWKVAYIEGFSPELKQQMADAQQKGEALEMGRLASQAHRFVSRIGDTNWYSLATPEGEQIINEWAKPGPGGVTPVVCTP